MPSRGQYWKEGGLLNASVINADVKDGTLTNAKLVNSTIQSGKISFFKSAEITGDGSEQDTAHSLGRTPALVLIIPTKVNAETHTFVTGTANGTVCKTTVSTGSKYIVIAL